MLSHRQHFARPAAGGPHLSDNLSFKHDRYQLSCWRSSKNGGPAIRLSFIACLCIALGMLVPQTGAAAQSEPNGTPQSRPELVLRTGQAGDIDAVQFSSSGNLFASSSFDGTVVVWDVAQLQERVRIQAQSADPELRFSPDDSWLYVLESSGIVKYSTSTKVPGTLVVPGYFFRLSLSDDGKWMVYRDFDSNSFLFNLSTHDTQKLPYVGDISSDFAFDSTSTLLAFAVGSSLFSFKLSGGSVTQLPQFDAPEPIVTYEFSSSGDLVVASKASDEVNMATDIHLHRVRVTSTAGQPSRVDTYTVHIEFPPTQIMLRDAGRVLVLLGRYENDWQNRFTITTNDSGIRVLTPPTAAWAGVGFLSHPAAADVSREGTKYVTATPREFAFYDLDRHAKRSDFAGPVAAVERSTISKNRFLLVEYENQASAVWDLEKGVRLLTVRGTVGLGGDNTLAYFGPNHNLYLRDLVSGQTTTTTVQVTGLTKALRISEPARTAVWIEIPSLASPTASLMLWNWKTGGKATAICDSISWFDRVEMSPTGNQFAATCDAGRLGDTHLYLWETASLSKKDFGPCSSMAALAFSPDGRYLAVGSGHIVVHDTQSSQSYEFGKMPNFNDAARGGIDLDHITEYENTYSSISFSSDDRSVIAGVLNRLAGSGSIERWTDWQTRTPVQEHLVQHLVPVATVEATDKYFLAGTVDGAARLFDWKSAEEIVTLVSIPGSGWVVVQPDGLFDGVADAIQWIGWRASQSSPLTTPDVFFEEFYHPGLFAEIMSGEHPRAPVSQSIADLLNLPGLDQLLAARLVSFKQIGNDFGLCLPTEPSQDLLDHLSVYRNAEPSPLKPSDFALLADPDCNYFKKLPGDLKNYQIVSSTTNQAPKKEPRPYSPEEALSLAKTSIYFQAVTFKNYPHISDLRFSVSDGKSLHEYFESQAFPSEKDGGPHWVEEPPLGDGNTVPEIRKRLADIGSASKPEDIVILFFSGHGSVPPGQEMFYFLPNYTEGRSPEQVRDAGMNTAMFADAIRGMNARRILLILDSCQSGGVLDSLSRAAEAILRTDKDGSQVAIRSTIPRTVAIIAAATPFQDAVEQGDGAGDVSGSGLLTRAIRETLANADVNTVRELVDRLPSQVKEILQRNPNGRNQDPEQVVVGGDIPLHAEKSASVAARETEKK